MMTSGSLQRRLVMGLTLAVALLWLLASLWATLALRHELDESFDESLASAARQLLSLTAHYAASDQAGAPVVVLPALRGARDDDDDDDEGFVFQVRGDAGQILLRSADANPGIFPNAPFAGFRETGDHRLYGLSTSGGLFIEVAEPLEHRREAMLEAATILALPLLLLLPLSLLGVWWFLRQSLRPLRAFRDEIEARGGSDLSPLQARAVPTELAPLVEAMNRLLERMQHALQAERSFTANSAHELRTPIAAALAQTQRLLAEAPEGALTERARQVERALRDLARLSEKLLQLAKAEGGGLLAEKRRDLLGFLDLLIEEFGGDGDRRPIRFDRPPGSALVSLMDADAFAILMRNLIENALKHGAPGRPIDVKILDGGRVSVANSGPVIPSERLSRLTGRFVRDASAVEGTGLGLAIAEAIVGATGGSLELLSPARGRQDGFEAIVTLV